MASGNPADFLSPYYVNPSDCGTEVFFNFSLSSDGKNYLPWSKCMSNALISKGKHAFIDGKLPPPEKDSPDFAIWRRCDALVRSWIYNSIERKGSLFASAIYAKSAKGLWDDLHQRFYRGTPMRIYEIMAEIRSLRQGGLTVAAYYTKLRTVWNELDCYTEGDAPGCTSECDAAAAAAYKKAKDNERVCQFLMGLESDKYRMAKFQILSSESLPSLSKAYTLVVAEEELAAMRI